MSVTTILTYLTAFVSIIFAALYLFFKKKYSYWSKRNVPHSNPKFPLGDMTFSKNLAYMVEDLYNAGKNEPVFGYWMLHRPNLMINDLDLVKSVLVQDFHEFANRGLYTNEKDDPLSSHLFTIDGQKWKNLRASLSPTFTSGKMKTMFPIFEDISSKLIKVLKPIAREGGIVEMKDVVGRFTTDIIASCAYGLEASSLDNPENQFRQMGKRVFMPGVKTLLRTVTAFFVPDLAEMLKVITTDEKLSEFFLKVVSDTVEDRESNDRQRQDFMQLLIQLKNKGTVDDVENKSSPGDKFTMEMVAANAYVFLIGGYETTSTVLQFAMYELAKNQTAQTKLREEIQVEISKSGKMTYEGLFSLKYMGMVIDEILRLYPPAPILVRVAGRDYKVPNSKLVIEKGTPVNICIRGIQRDERYFPNPEEFNPERFSDEEKAKRHHYSYLPFGDGPRFCIGQRFAMMQMRAALFAVFSKYRIEPCEKTQQSIIFDPKAFSATPHGGVYVRIIET